VYLTPTGRIVTVNRVIKVTSKNVSIMKKQINAVDKYHINPDRAA